MDFEMIKKFNEFKKNYNGNAQQTIQYLLSSGQMSQKQFDELKQQASMLVNILK